MRTRRVFWLGAHKVLKRTELRDLRALGLEVFNPAYITPVYDQSADLRIDLDQPTTLPPDVFHELLSYDFFYNQITPRIFEILNSCFDAAIVTINADWLKALLAGFKGQVIYRTYGQHFCLSDKLLEIGLWPTLMAHPRFTIVPFAAESVEHEHRWFLDLCRHIVPYQIPDDVFARSSTWAGTAHRPEIATSIPNLQNSYFAAAYAEFCARFPHRLFRIYGPQRAAPADSRLVGALERDTLLDRFAASAGFLYDYRDAVCYLPPVEMMEIGGPVIYAPGSLLSRMYGRDAPGMMLDQADAEKKMHMLLKADAGFIREVVAAQDCVRRRYDRAVSRPVFDQAFRALLTSAEAEPPKPPPEVRIDRSGAGKPKLVILLHVDGLLLRRKGQVYAFEGIPRVVDVIVAALVRFSDLSMVVTCTVDGQPALHDFFADAIRAGRLALHPVDCGGATAAVDGYENRLRMVRELNEDDSIACVLVPHYYLFPEALLVAAPTALYLPDYFPHLMPGVVFDVSAEKDAENRDVGVAVAAKSVAILTASRFTAGYLPEAGFVEPGSEKVRVIAPLPLLGAARATALEAHEVRVLQDRLSGRPYILYPTANRPNKQLAFLLRVVAAVRVTRPDVMLVLTCSLGHVPAAAEAFHRYGLEEHTLFLPGVDEASLRWLYENSAALCLTSTLEGNFPPQVLEALEYRTPVVATRLTTILDEVGAQAEDLLLCDPLDLDDFRAKLGHALADRDGAVARQERVLLELRERSSLERFYERLGTTIAPLVRRPRSRQPQSEFA